MKSSTKVEKRIKTMDKGRRKTTDEGRLCQVAEAV